MVNKYCLKMCLLLLCAFLLMAVIPAGCAQEGSDDESPVVRSPW